MDEAAQEVLGVLDPISQRHKVELGGYISASSNGFTYGTPIVGTQGYLPLINVPGSAVAGFHTHPSGVSSFSLGDARWVRGTNGNKIPLYASGGGQIRICEVSGSACNPGIAARVGGPDATNRYLQGRAVP